MPHKTKSKSKHGRKDRELEEQLIKDLQKQEEELQAKKEADRAKAEQERKERLEQKRTEIRNRILAEERHKIERKLRELKEIYDKKYEQKLDYGVHSVEKAKMPIPVVSDDLIQSKYGFNVVAGDHIFPIENAYATFCRTFRRDPQDTLACKIINLAKAPPDLKKSLEAGENTGYKIITFLATLGHPNLVKIIEVYLCYDKLYIIQEFLCDTLDMYLRVGSGLNENRTRHFARNVGEALLFLHTHAIAHRNIHKCSVLIDRSTNAAKLSDFEFCCLFWKPAVKEMALQMPLHVKDNKFLSPEATKDKPYDVRAGDVWQWADLVVYMLTKGHSPNKDFPTWSKDKLKNVSEECIEILTKCLSVDPESRPEMNTVLTSIWFKVFVDLAE